MKRIALWGYYGFGNVGDEALLSTVLPHLNDVIVHLFSGDSPSVTQRDNLILESRSPMNLLKVIRRCDAFILGPGGLLHERPKAKSTWYHLAGLILAKVYGKPHIAIGQQIGSFRRSMTKRLVRLGLSKVDYLSVRDKRSYEEAESLGLHPILSADMAFLIEPHLPAKHIIEQIKNLPTPRIAFTPAISDEYKPDPAFIASILNSLYAKTGGSIIMLPFFPGRDDDIISAISNHLECTDIYRLQSPLNWRDAFGVFQLVDYSVPMRLHAMIASAISHKPFLPILYHEKVKRIGMDIGCTTFISEHDADPYKKVEDFLDNADTQMSKIHTNLKIIKDRASLSVNALKDFKDELIQHHS